MKFGVRDEDERNPFFEDLALVAVPALIAIIPDLLRIACGCEPRDEEDMPHKSDPPPPTASFREYVRHYEQSRKSQTRPR